MRITIQPETTEEEQEIRSRAAAHVQLPEGTTDPMFFAVVQACVKWAKDHPPKPGPGSVLRCNGCFGKPLRIVTEDGTLMDTSGRTRCDESWRIGTGQQEYTLVYEFKEES